MNIQASSSASGAKPEAGLFSAVVGGFVISALGGSRFQIGGPASAFIVFVAKTIFDVGYGPKPHRNARQAAHRAAGADVQRMMAQIIAGKTATPRAKSGRGGNATGGPGVAARTVGMLATILQYAAPPYQGKPLSFRRLTGSLRKSRLCSTA